MIVISWRDNQKNKMNNESNQYNCDVSEFIVNANLC